MPLLQKALLIGLGGAFGSMARYYVQTLLQGRPGIGFPYGTLVVNMTGCLLIGFLMTLFLRRETIDESWRFFLVVGVCGGYTTFSAFSWETFQLFKAGSWEYALLYTLCSVIGGLAMLWTGTCGARLF